LAIKEWLECVRLVDIHKEPKAFDGLRGAYCEAVATARNAGLSNRDAHRAALSGVTDLLYGNDLASVLRERLSQETFNTGGMRSPLYQSFVKNVGENFVNVIVYALATLLADQDDILVDKGMPRALKDALWLKRTVPLKTGDMVIDIKIEGDAAVFSRQNCLNAIVISAKTRLKEVFHIGTMWKMLFDTLGDKSRLQKWGLTRKMDADVSKVLYVFATADLVKEGGKTCQGGDVKRPKPRNLIAMDASFFDYVFVSMTGIGHVENKIDHGTRGALFHELGCLVDLIEQKFEIHIR
jgi:hypothetical protein